MTVRYAGLPNNLLVSLLSANSHYVNAAHKFMVPDQRQINHGNDALLDSYIYR